MKIKAAAKINLSLDVCGILENGYHSINSVFQTVGLYDEVEVTLNNSGEISVRCQLPESFRTADPVPDGEKNIAYRAAREFLREIGSKKGCDIVITKGIPSQAGMGGGSTDAAAVIHCLNQLTDAGLDGAALGSVGKRIGADVPFFFTGGTALVMGIGDVISRLPDYSGRILVIGKGREGVSTAEAYRKIDALEAPVHPDINALVRALRSDPDGAYMHFGNLFEAAADLPEVEEIRRIMGESGALSAVMTGSGSAVFGLFADLGAAGACYEELTSKGYFSVECTTVGEAFVDI